MVIAWLKMIRIRQSCSTPRGPSNGSVSLTSPGWKPTKMMQPPQPPPAPPYPPLPPDGCVFCPTRRFPGMPLRTRESLPRLRAFSACCTSPLAFEPSQVNHLLLLKFCCRLRAFSALPTECTPQRATASRTGTSPTRHGTSHPSISALLLDRIHHYCARYHL